MEFYQKKTNDIKITDENEHQLKFKEDSNYLYPNGHRITHQVRWFKGSRDRGYRSNIAA